LHEQEILQDELKRAEDQMEAAVQKVDVEKASLAQAKSKMDDLEVEIRSQKNQLDIVRSEVKELATKEDNISIKIDSLRKEISETEVTTTEQDEPMEDFPLDQLEDQRSKLHQDLRSQAEEQRCVTARVATSISSSPLDSFMGRVMEQVKSSISVESVERAIACEHEITCFRAELDSSSAELASLSTRQHETAVAR
jgi:chromosome segregation ATPase